MCYVGLDDFFFVLIHIYALHVFTEYSNLPLKYALWTWAVGTHLVGRCVLYLYCFLDPLIWWIATGNGWNLRQPTWPKPNNVKSLQRWENRTRQASGHWGGSMKSVKAPYEKSRTIGRTYCNEIQLIETFEPYGGTPGSHRPLALI